MIKWDSNSINKDPKNSEKVQNYLHLNALNKIGLALIEMKNYDDSLSYFQQVYEIKAEIMGPGREHKKEKLVLNRVVRWTEEGLEYEADPRQAEQLCRDLGLVGAKSIGTPGVKMTSLSLLYKGKPCRSARSTSR